MEKQTPIGSLNKFITVRKRQDLPSLDNQTQPCYSKEKKRWASIKPVSSSIYLLGMQTDNDITHRITLRRMPEIDTDYEIVHGLSLYRVVRQIDLEGANRFTAVDVVELNQGEI